MREIFDNINSKYLFEAPCVELGSFIEYYWESSIEGPIRGVPFSVKLFPSWTPTFSFNLGSPCELTLGKDNILLDENSDVLNFRNKISAYKYGLSSRLSSTNEKKTAFLYEDSGGNRSTI